MTYTLNHTQAYVLGSIAKHSDNYQRAMTSLNTSVQAGIEYGPRRGLNIDAANKAHFAAQIIEELLDQLWEMFEVEPEAQRAMAKAVDRALKPTERGTRARFSEGDEY